MYRNIVIAAASKAAMGHSPNEPAPAYDDVHPVNSQPASGSASAYRTIPGEKSDIKLAHNHPAPPDALTPHQYCETCDTLTTAREVRANERHCCLWVSIVFMTISVAMMLLGIVALDAKYKHRKD